ncbi:MAG: phosphoenolpyruvate--protein phosphotransferase [Planctomycetes bacterium]|nr:phosphoenolpyruvate--protein phosphotransferase [Planctomycetota bacterium]
MPEVEFQCPLPNGLHARPASTLAERVARFGSAVELTNQRSGACANARSVLEMVALGVKLGDRCRLSFAGADADEAARSLRTFVDEELPVCDEALPAENTTSAACELPRGLRASCSRWYTGTVVCPGIGEGRVVVVGGARVPPALLALPAVAAAQERERFASATASVRAALETRLASRPAAVEEGILHAHLSIVRDVGMTQRVAAGIAAGRSAIQAVAESSSHFADLMRGAESAYVRERAIDIEDIAFQIIEALHGSRLRSPQLDLAEDSVVVAESLTPRQFLALEKQFLKALVLEHTGGTSHAVILARSFGIPTLTGVADVRAHVTDGGGAVVDAHLGIVIPDPAAAVRRFYAREQQTLRRREERLARFTGLPARTRDAQVLEVAANVATLEELGPAFASGADGIGLFRTEMLFMDREAPPSEEEQFAIYLQAARAAQGRTVIVRTFDVGGDKPVPYLDLAAEKNPFLGRRGVRVYPGQAQLFRTQLRAILRASAFGVIWMMVPMVNSLEELRWVKARIAEARAELDASGRRYDPALRVGVMLEIPSAVFGICDLASEADFFSIGTNDLLQYFMAVDREDAGVAGLASARHPSFLRLLSKIVADARAAGRWVGMCGEMTRSPRNLPLLVGLGLDEISTAAPEIPGQKAAIANLSFAACRELLERALACGTTAQVEELVAHFREQGAAQNLLESEFVCMDSDSRSKEEAIQELVSALYVAGRTEQPRALEDAIWAREAVYSTGLGFGFAIPHCKSDAVCANSIAVLRLAQPIEWGSMDGEPVRCVILLAMRASDQEGAHMKVFSRLARRLMHEEFRERMLAARDRGDVLSCLTQELELPPHRIG